MPIYVNPNQRPEKDDSGYSRPNSVPYLPKGEYQIIRDGQVIGLFGSLDEAQQKLVPGSYVKPPDKRATMKEPDIVLAESIARNWGKRAI